MISRRQLPELRAFARVEAKLPLQDAPECASLVVPNGNGQLPVHHWFRYKEAFSADLLKYVLDHVAIAKRPEADLQLLDPFCGVGTGLLSAQTLEDWPHGISSIGIECNPFAAFIARAKVGWPHVDPERLVNLASQLLSYWPAVTTHLPRLSSITTGRCISRYMATQIISIRNRIQALPDSAERNVLLTGLASCVEPVSKTRRDGRALRIVEKPRIELRSLLATRWAEMATDVAALQQAHREPSPTEVRCGDGREPGSAGIADGTIDLILTSPPYPNNIDYNEIYKLELWLLGFVTAADEFLALRRRTFRSHPTCRPATEEPDYQHEFAKLLKNGALVELLGTITRKAQTLEQESSRGRSKVLVGYAYDAWRTLRAHWRTLRAGGYAIYVVGNSLHGGPSSRHYLIPTDLLFGRLGELAGFRVERIAVARSLSRRLAGNHFLRDSIVVLRKS